jgi:hypothetical protein
MRSSSLRKSIGLYPKNIIDQVSVAWSRQLGGTDVVHWSESQKKAQAFGPGFGLIRNQS